MHWLTRISIGNRWITFLIVVAIIVGSIFATLQLKTELIPDIELPVMNVVAMYQGHSPEDVRDKITMPIEEAIEGIGGLKHIESISQEGVSSVIATFEYGTDMNAVRRDIEANLNGYPKELLDKEQLVVVPISLELMPLVMLQLFSDSVEMTTAELRDVANLLTQKVSDEVEGILPADKQTPFMKSVEIMGGQEDVLVIPSPDSINGLEWGGGNGNENKGIPISWVIRSIEMNPTYTSPEALKGTALYGFTEKGTPFRLEARLDQVATVLPKPIPASHTNGKPSVSIIWRKDPDANTVDVANAIMAKVEEFESSGDCPEHVDINVVMDQSEMIEESISDLGRDAIIGMILAVIVVFLFLWAFRASLIVIVSIPISILIAFLLMYVFDITINILTLGGLAIAVGRIVDNSIVALENIYRHLQRGEGFRQAAIEGIKEIAMPITSATIATVAIFIPLMLVGGIVGEMFRPFALTVTFALLVSLVVALMVVPPLSSFITTRSVRFEGADNWYTRAYTRTLRWSLGHRAITLLIAVALFIVSLALPAYGVIGTTFLPSAAGNMITVEIEMPHGNDQDLRQIAEKVEGEVGQLDKIKSYYTIVGSPLMGGMSGGGIATLMIELESDADVEQQADVLRQECEDLCKQYENTEITVISGEMMEEMMAGGRLDIRVVGKEGAEFLPVEELTTRLVTELEELERKGDLENLESELVLDLTNPAKEWDKAQLAGYARGLEIDPTNQEEMTRLITQLELEWVRMRFGWPLGGDGSTVTVEGQVADIFIPGVVKGLSDISKIEELSIGATQPTQLRDIATVDWGAATYRRAEGGYAGTVNATITADDVGRVNREVQEIIDGLVYDPDEISEIKMGGVAEQMEEGFKDMGIAIILAIVIVFVVLAISFRSWLTPLLIMFSMPLALIGAMLGLLVTGRSLGISSMMGILMLVGIVLTNAIVLLTFVEDRRKEGYNTHDALMDAGRIRLRPILMTALTTMVALVPLSLGLSEGGLIAAELGVVVIGGLFSSTLLTLLVIPVLYSLTDRFRRHPSSQRDSSVEIP